MHVNLIHFRMFASAAYMLLFALAAAAKADVLVSNLTEPVRSYNIIQPTEWAAQSFRTDPSSYSLISIEILAGYENQLVGAFAELRRSNAYGNMDVTPGGLITTLRIPDLTGPREPRAFVPRRTVRLEPSTLYYIALGVRGSGTFEWSYAIGNETTGPGSLGQYEYCFDDCITWNHFGTVDPFHIQINVGPPLPFCVGDPNDDRDRNFLDITTILAHWNAVYAPNELGPGDSNGDGTVDFTDLTSVLANYGIPCPN